MASFYRDNQREGYRVQVFIRGVRRKLWLGNVPTAAAKTIADHLERLKIAVETATAPPVDTTRWARACSERIRKQMANWGLIELGTSIESIPRTVGGYSQHYIDSRTDLKPRSLQRFRNVRMHLLAQWPAHTSLAAITPGDADAFARNIRKKHKPSHAGKLLSDCRQIFRSACRFNLLDSNPFTDVDCSAPHDTNREAYVTAADANKLIELASPQLAALIAAARFAGLRVPSEPLALQIAHINWQDNRFTVTDTKRSTIRSVPIFTEFRPHLTRQLELLPDGSQFIFHRARQSAATQWRDQLERLILLAGLNQWPKLWQNLRASCRTDLESRFPGFVVDQWLGHSAKIGAKHYTRIHAEHYALACGALTQNCGAPGGAHPPTVPDTTRQQNQSQAKKSQQKRTANKP
jgi:integrase